MPFRVLFLLFTAMAVFGQEIEDILDRDPFDPDRGQEEILEDEQEEVAEIPIGEKPILDATILMGEIQMALFTIKVEGRPETVRASLNESFGGYTLTHVDRNFVELTKGGGKLKLSMFNGEKTNRGGSAKARRPAPRGKAAPVEPKVLSGKSSSEAAGADEAEKKPVATAPPATDPRPQPRPTPRPNKRLEDLRNKAKNLTGGKF